MTGSGTIRNKQATESGLHPQTSSAEGVQQQQAHDDKGTQSSPTNKQRPIEQLKSKPKEEQIDKVMVIQRKIYVSRESTGGYADETTDVHVTIRAETHILRQHLAKYEQECEDGADGYQASEQVSYSLVHI